MDQKFIKTYQLLVYILLIWLILFSLNYFKEYYSIIILQQIEAPAYYLFIRSLISWSVIFVYIYAVYYLTKVAPLHQVLLSNLKWHIGVFFIGFFLIPAWNSILYYWIRSYVPNLPDPYPLYVVYGSNLRSDLLVIPFLHLFIVIGAWFLTSFKEHIRDKTLFIRKRNELIKSKLNTLKAKIDPHFLFNTLQGVSNLAYTNRAAAHDMLLVLKDLFKNIEENLERALVPLSEEIDFTKKYLYLEKCRFQDKLIVDIAVDPECGDILVPPYILQPIIENSFKHVVSKSLEISEIRINCQKKDGFLCLNVEDSGSLNRDLDHLLSILNNNQLGFGLSNVKERLSVINASSALLFTRSNLGGLKSTIKITDDLQPIR